MTVTVHEIKPGKVAIDMQGSANGTDATVREVEALKALQCGLKAACVYLAKHADKADVIEGADIEKAANAMIARAMKE